ADGKLYLTSEDGVTTVIAAGPEFRVLAENELEGYTLSSMAVSGGRLYYRNARYLYAIGDG
ncbi:MAG: pyrrolo-quinoline quinone, partial [Thermoanaerobaculia bacterium]|nr:pyrrolo-quinoline quinone [Thermoanaerobaculia bacterium]